MEHSAKRTGTYTYLAIAAVILFTAYFALFLNNAYSTFHDYSDLGIMSYSLYFNLNYPGVAHGLQLIIFGNHIAPDMLLVLPFYYLAESSLTLLYIQLVYVSLAGLAVFLVARELTKNEFLSLVMCVAFLIYPGTVGLVIFDAHIEFPITLFYILTFYFYMRPGVKGFLLSLLLLLGSAEVALLMALGLGAGLAVYEYRYNGDGRIDRGRHLKLILFLLFSVIALVFYYFVTYSLGESYATAFPALPGFFYITLSAQSRIVPAILAWASNPVGALGAMAGTYFPGFLPYLAYALLLSLLGFGIAAGFVPLTSLALLAPWLAGIFVLVDISFVLPFSEYFSYVMGPAVCAAILGMISYKNRHGGWLYRFITILNIKPIAAISVFAVALPLLLSVCGPLFYLFVASPVSVYHSTGIGDLGQLLLFQSDATQRAAYSQLDWIISKVPPNASLVTDSFIMPHVVNREDVWYLSSIEYFTPQYILVDLNKSISGENVCNVEDCGAFYNLTEGGNYSIYMQNGTAILYKRNGQD